MRRFLHSRTGQTIAIFVILASAWTFADPSNYLYALEVHRQKVERVRQIARNLNIDPEILLHPQQRRAASSSSIAPSAAPPQNILDAVARVKSRYGLAAADATLAKIADLVRLAGQPSAARANKHAQIRAEMKSLLRVIDKDFLPPLPDKAPGVARQRDAQMRNAMHQLAQDIKRVINAPGALDDANLEATIASLSNAAGSTMTLRGHKRRWTKDPFPLHDTFKTALKKQIGSGSRTSTTSTPSVVTTAAAPLRPAANDVAADVTSLAASLRTPAKIFTWVHDNILWESYSGVAKGAAGTLAEKRGNDWDQAVLLRDMLTSQGFQAQLEWGQVTLPVSKAMNLAGTEDPVQAANLFATGGLDGQILLNGSTPVAVQMTHAWVRAFIPYIPNRGATTGTADTWVRMDPSFKRFDYQPGIAINGHVPWSEDQYLSLGVVRAPEDYYSDRIWDYIHAANLNCQNLAQVAKSPAVHAEAYPFVPSTLTARIEGTPQTSPTIPNDQLQSVTVTLIDGNGATVGTWSNNIAAVWGKKVSLTFAPATPDDAAIIASYGGLFNTPAYLIRLTPIFSVDDVQAAAGQSVPAGAALDMNVAFHQPNVSDDFTHHDVVAGETHTLVFDPGAIPNSLVASRINRSKTLAPGSDAALTEKLFLAGLRYMQHADEGLAFAADVRWQRAVKRVFEGDVRQQIDVAYNVAGAPLRLTLAEENIDVSRLPVGIVPINNDLSNRAEVFALAGLQSSWLEGAVWEEMQSQQGISAAKALLLSRRAGQTLYTVDASNVDSVLATVNLPADVEDEVRGAVGQGRIARIPSSSISVNHWTGTGYILRDPVSGAATYPISGNLAGGSTTGEATEGIRELLGSESWLNGSPLGDLLRQLLDLLGGGGDSGSGNPSTTQSDPVNLSSGNMYRTATDFSIVARGIPVALTRTYNSRSTYNGPFGYGWTFNYGEMLIDNGDGTITYREADGTEHTFVNYVSPPGKHLTLTQSGSDWTLRFKDGTLFTFNANGLLVSQADLKGNAVTINRDGAGNITTVVDASGRTVLTFTSAGKVTKVTDPAGRSVIYGYTGDDLTSVTDTAGKVWSMTYDLAHNMTSYADPLGNTQSYDYDADDRLMHHVDATGAEEYFHYDIAGRQSVITDRRGGDRLVEFDDLGRATMETDPAGNMVKASFDADNNRTQTIDSRNNATSFEFDAQGNATKQTNPDGGVIATTYDANSRPLQSTDALGTTTTNSYDSSGNLLTSSRTVSGVTETTTNTFDSHGLLLTTTDPSNRATSMTWNDNGTLATRTDVLNHTTTISTDPLGRITSVKDPNQNETKLSYDNKDRILTMTDPYNNSTSFAYDDAGRRKSVTTPRGTTTYSYDAEGRVTSVVDALGNTSKTAYNAAGDVISRTDARGNTTTYEYDAVGRVTKMTDATGGVWTYGYCGAIGGGAPSCSSCGGGGGSFCDLFDSSGNHIHQEFDIMGRVVSVTDSLSHSSFTQYDKAGRKTVVTDANGNATRYGYDEAGRLVAVTEASGAVTRYSYDKSGNKLTQTDANNHTWTFSYDELNRLKEEKDPLNRTTSYTYDALGNLQTKTDAKGQVTTYTYNIRRLTGMTYPGGADTFTYDAFGRRSGATNANVSFTYGYDSLNRVTSVANTTYNHTMAYAYDATGNIATRTITANGFSFWLGTNSVVTRYSYDAKNRLTTIVDPFGGTFRFAYDPMDRRTSLTNPNGTVSSYNYDNAYRITSIATKNGRGEVVDAWSYQYDAVGNRISKTDMDGKSETYRYDTVDRLAEANYPDGTREAFTYDPVGNRLTRSDQTGTTTTYSYDVANQMLSAGADTFTYDANGSMLTKTTSAGATTLAYDGMNRVASISGPDGTETNLWGPNGQRVQLRGTALSNETSGAARPIYDLAGNPVADANDSNGMLRYRVYGPGVDEPLVELALSQGAKETSFFHHDALGSITCATDPNGTPVFRTRYAAFGQRTVTAINTDQYYQTRLSYTSRENSVGSLMQYRSRYYDVAYGRFAQQDVYRGNDLTPPSLQRYEYVVNNPVRYIDPSGRVGEEVFAAAVLTIGGLLVGASIVEFFWILGIVVLIAIAAIAVVSLVWCLFDARCRRTMRCIFGYIIRYFTCAIIQNNEAHPLNRAGCMSFCLEKLRDWFAACKEGGAVEMPWVFITFRCKQPPIPPTIFDPGGDELPFEELEQELGKVA
jgi:RHS repeat-associated protein